MALYFVIMLLQTLSAPTLVNDDFITGLNLLYNDVLVDFCKYCVAAFLLPIKIFVASEILIPVIASTKIGVASLTALLAALFKDLIPSSAKLPKPTSRKVFSTFCNSLRSEEHTSELQSRENLVCRLLL